MPYSQEDLRKQASIDTPRTIPPPERKGMTTGLKYLLIAIVVLLLAFAMAGGGLGFIFAVPLFYALFRLITLDTKPKG